MSARHRLNDARAAALATLRPPDLSPLSDWLEATLRLPRGQSAIPGPIRLWTFQRGLADAMTDPGIERVTVLKGARLGYSTLLVGVLAHFAVRDPTSLLCVLPTEDDARNFVVGQLESAMDASPGLRGVLAMDRSADARDTLMFRKFPGGSLRVVAARAPRNLRAHTARVLVLDEADAMEATTEGSPILLAEKRTLSFGDRKIIMGSTPTNTTTSHVHAAYEQSDRRIYECRCPSCGAHHEILWRDIRWPEGRPDEAAWCCPSCGALHGERHKPAMVAGGRWRATAPDVKDHAGFRLSCLIAPHAPASWGKLAAEFVVAKRHPDTLRTFVNTILAEPWNDDGDDASAPHELQSLAETVSLDSLPDDVLFLTSGVDVQVDRLEIATLGFTADDEWAVLDHRAIFGDPHRDDVWADLDDLLRATHAHPAGGKLACDATCIDAGDGNVMARVLAFAASRRHARVVAVKGATGARPPLQRSESRRAHGLHICGVDGIKTRLFDRLARRKGVRFSDALPGAFYEQLVSERSVVRYQRGQPSRIFERIPGRRAEALDCVVYALAARTLVATSPTRRADDLRGEAPATTAPAVFRSAWLAYR